MSALKHREQHEGTVIKKVSRREEDGAHGGAWKVAFADFVLALMCLFLVLWVLAAREQENLEQLLRDGGGKPTAEGTNYRIEHQGTPPGSLIPREPVPGMSSSQQNPNSQVKTTGFPTVLDGEGRRVRQKLASPAALNQLAQMLSSMSKQAGLESNLQLVVTPQGLRVMLHDTDREGMFERGSAIINRRFKGLLLEMGQLLSSLDNQLLVIGHTDAMQYRSAGNTALSNWSLSANRAMSARLHLLDGGLRKESVLQVVGMADRAPLDKRQPTAAHNRRIELLVLTPTQADSISAMFGPPQAAGADEKRSEISVAPNPDLDMLRAKMNNPG